MPDEKISIQQMFISLFVSVILIGFFVAGVMWVYWEFFSPMKDCPNDEAVLAMQKYAPRASSSMMCFDACSKMAQEEKRTVFCRCPCATCRDILGVCFEGVYSYSHSETITKISTTINGG